MTSTLPNVVPSRQGLLLCCHLCDYWKAMTRVLQVPPTSTVRLMNPRTLQYHKQVMPQQQQHQQQQQQQMATQHCRNHLPLCCCQEHQQQE